MSEFDDTKPSDSMLGDILARTTLFKFRVTKLPDGLFGVFADMFLVEQYENQDQARALCNRLIHQQALEIKKTILKSTGPSHLPPQNNWTEYD